MLTDILDFINPTFQRQAGFGKFVHWRVKAAFHIIENCNDTVIIIISMSGNIYNLSYVYLSSMYITIILCGM